MACYDYFLKKIIENADDSYNKLHNKTQIRNLSLHSTFRSIMRSIMVVVACTTEGKSHLQEKSRINYIAKNNKIPQ